MRNEGILKFILGIGAILFSLIILNLVALHTVRRQYSPANSAAASILNFSGQTKEWLVYFKKWKSLSSENGHLKELLSETLSAKSIDESFRIESDNLKKTNNLSKRLRHELVPAGIFDFSLTPDGYHALINKGSTNGILVGQTIVSLEGELVGRVTSVFSNSSQVSLLTDTNFSVTGRVLGGETSGIIHGALSNGLNFDLVTQSDTISEGDTIITTGDDMVPAGIVIGTVKNVQDNDTQLFKKIIVDPSMNLGQGSVAVIK